MLRKSLPFDLEPIRWAARSLRSDRHIQDHVSYFFLEGQIRVWSRRLSYCWRSGCSWGFAGVWSRDSRWLIQAPRISRCLTRSKCACRDGVDPSASLPHPSKERIDYLDDFHWLDKRILLGAREDLHVGLLAGRQPNRQRVPLSSLASEGEQARVWRLIGSRTNKTAD